MPACDVVVPRRCDVRFNDVTSLARHFYNAIFFFNAESTIFLFLNTNHLWNRIFRYDKQIITWAFWSSP